MDSSSSETATIKQPTRPSGRGTSRPYLFCLTAVCTLLTGVTFLGGMLSVHDASTTVLLRVANLYVSDVTPKTVEQQVRDNLAPAMAKVGLDPRATARLRIRTMLDEDQDVRIVLGFADVDSLRARTLVDKLADECVARHRRRVQQQLRRAISNANQQIERIQEEKLRLDEEISRFLDEVLQPTTQVSVHRWDAHPFRKRLRRLTPPGRLRGEGTMLATAEAEDEVTPEQVRAEIAERQQELRQLRQNMTLAHPEVQLAWLDLQRLQAALLNLEPIGEVRLVTSLEDVAGGEAPSAAGPQLSARPLSQLEASASAELKPLIEKLRKLNQEHQDRAAEQRVVLDRFGNLEDHHISTLLSTGQSVRLDPARWPRFAGLMALLSLLGGFGMVLVARRGDRAFVSPDQASRELPVPVVGLLLRGDTSRTSTGLTAYRVHRGARITCEVLLGGIVFWVILHCLFDGAFLGEFVSDPLGSLAMAWQRTWG